jgi:hypothetical protein
MHYFLQTTLHFSASSVIFLISFSYLYLIRRPGQLSPYSYSLRAGQSAVRISVVASTSAPIQTGRVSYPASNKQSSWRVALTTNPHLVTRLKKE